MVDQPKRIEEQILKVAEDSIRKLQPLMYQALTFSTPVDTGFARSRWRPSIGVPNIKREKRPPVVSTRGDQEVSGLLRSAVIAEAQAQLALNKAKAQFVSDQYFLSQGAAYLVNAARHIVPLNMGSSSQAPTQFVERAITQSVLRLARFVR